MIKLTFPDGSIKEYKKGVKVIEVIESISISLKKKCLAGKLNDSLLNLDDEINEDGSILFITPESKEAFEDISALMNKMLSFNPEKIILGCTHYPYLKNVLNKFVDKSLFIDPAQIFVEYIKTDLEKLNLLSEYNISTENFYVSANPEDFIKHSKIFYDVKECLVNV